MINTGNEDKKSWYPTLMVWCETILTCLCSSDICMCELLTVVIAVFYQLWILIIILRMNDNISS